MISSRFGPSRKEPDGGDHEAAAISSNNDDEPTRKSTDDEASKKESIYGKPRIQESLNVQQQQYSKSSYGECFFILFVCHSINNSHHQTNCAGQFGGQQQQQHPYNYQNQQQQPNVPLPGQLQTPGQQQIQPSLPGQSAQLHVTHHSPPVQTVHQTQVPNFQSSSSVTGQQQQQQQQIQARDYMATTTVHPNSPSQVKNSL